MRLEKSGRSLIDLCVVSHVQPSFEYGPRLTLSLYNSARMPWTELESFDSKVCPMASMIPVAYGQKLVEKSVETEASWLSSCHEFRGRRRLLGLAVNDQRKDELLDRCSRVPVDGDRLDQGFLADGRLGSVLVSIGDLRSRRTRWGGLYCTTAGEG